MIVNAVYHGTSQIHRVYHGGEIVFERGPIEFHALNSDGTKLVIVGALSALELPDGVYLDCAPDWIYPEQNGNVLTIEQVYSATKNGFVLEVE